MQGRLQSAVVAIQAVGFIKIRGIAFTFEAALCCNLTFHQSEAALLTTFIV
jgi:hypothetical protein